MNYNKAYEFMKRIQQKNNMVFNCALSQIMTDGIDNCVEYNLDEISIKIPDDAMLGKDFQIEIFKTAKEIATNISPWNILTYFAEEVPAVGRRTSREKLYKSMQRLIEKMLYPEDGGDHLSEEEIMEIADLDEDEWDEIMRG